MIWLVVATLSTLVFEPFNSLGLWTVTDGNGDGATWTADFTYPGGLPTPSGFSGSFAVYNDDAAGSGAPATQEVMERVVGLPGVTLSQLVLEFDYAFYAVGGDTFRVEAAYWSGGAWSTPEVIYESTQLADTGHISHAFSAAYLSAESLKVRFVYADDGAWGWGAAVDNVRILGDWSLAGDVGISAILSPQGWIPESDQQNVPVVVEVFSNDPSSTVNATLTVEVFDTAGNGPLYSQSQSVSLSPQSTQQVQMPAITGLPLDDRYRVVATLTAGGDPFTPNNTLSATFDLTPAEVGTILASFDLSGLLPAGQYLRGLDAAWGQNVLYLLVAQPNTANPPSGPHRYFVYRFDPATSTLTQLFEVPLVHPTGYTQEIMDYALDLAFVPDSGFFWISLYGDSAGTALYGQYLLKVDTAGVLLDTLNWADTVDLYGVPMGLDWDPVTGRLYVANVPSPGFGNPQVYRINFSVDPIYERSYETPGGVVYNGLAHVWDGTRQFVLARSDEIAFVEYQFDSLFWGDSVFTPVNRGKIFLNGIQGVDFVASSDLLRTARVWSTQDDGAGVQRLLLLSLGERYSTPVEEASGMKGSPLARLVVRGRVLELFWGLPAGSSYRLVLFDPLGRRVLSRTGRVQGVTRLVLPQGVRGVMFLKLQGAALHETRKILVP